MPCLDLLTDGKIGSAYLPTLAEAAAIGLITGATACMCGGYVGTETTASTIVRASTYIEQGFNAQRSINSTSASDTSAGIGARTVKITYLDSNGNGPYTEIVTLNGTTAVNTVATNIALIEKMEVQTVGSNGGNVGTIQLWTTTAGGGSIWASILAGDNQTYWAHHYVPTGKHSHIVSIRAASTGINGSLTINTLNPLNNTVPQRSIAGTLRYLNFTNTMGFSVPLIIPGPAIIFLNARMDSSAGTTTFASFCVYDF